MSTRNNKRTAIEILQEFSIPLIAGVVVAVIWANLNADGYHHVVEAALPGSDGHLNLHFLMNDVFMVLFFGMAAKEITESVLPGGPLNPVSKAINPLLGTLGGVVGPICLYMLYARLSGVDAISSGWGIPTATDIALAWLIARLVFGKGHPAVSFLLLLAIGDDAIGLGIIAVFYSDPTQAVRPVYLLITLVGMGLAFAMRKAEVKSFWAYLLVPGVLSWTGLFASHLHPALALVPVVPFMPHMDHDEGLFKEEGDGHRHFQQDTLNAFEHWFKKPVDFGLFGFGLANAGVEFSSMGHATWAVLLALILGKTIGIFGFSWLGTLLGFKLPNGMDLRALLVTGVIGALGLTVALFVAGVAFTDADLQGSAKMGALLSVFVAPLALVLGKLLRVKMLPQSSHLAIVSDAAGKDLEDPPLPDTDREAA